MSRTPQKNHTQNQKSLRLRKETLRQLDPSDLQQVGGGGIYYGYCKYCYRYCYTRCR